MPDPIALAVPMFFVLIGLELAWAKRRGVKVYGFTDALTDLSCGITSQVVLLVRAAAQLGAYAWVYEHARLFTIEPTWLAWFVAFVGVDFLYYWWHRLSHEVNFLWAAHVVHHQSEDYNLAVALRQAVLTSWTALPFYLPLAVLGVPVAVYAIVHALSTLYQFRIHTQLVGRIRGPLDWILNLPSHHRVHHAINERYLDKNYGAMLIVWDRLFGTYAEEKRTEGNIETQRPAERRVPGRRQAARAARARMRRIEFLADSNISGFGVEGTADTCAPDRRSPKYDDVRKSAAHVIAMAFDA
jgi:sterol desaturase/sphingolipid hydroxylase (fatty acid hydroxylase superfamily)